MENNMAFWEGFKWGVRASEIAVKMIYEHLTLVEDMLPPEAAKKMWELINTEFGSMLSRLEEEK